MLTVAGVVVDKYIQPPHISDDFRARSVEYTLDGSAKEDRLGGTKRSIKLPFALTPATVWEQLKAELTRNTIPVSGFVGNRELTGVYRLCDDSIPTPVLVASSDYGGYVCQPFTITLEEI